MLKRNAVESEPFRLLPWKFEFVYMILLFLYSRIIVDVTKQKVNRCYLESYPIHFDQVFTLERMVLWTVPLSVPFQCEHGLKQ